MSTALKIRNEIALMHGKPMSVLSDCLRGFLVPRHGHDFVAADLSNIEGRMIAWLAGEEWKLDAFRGYDLGFLPDIYTQGYSRSFNVDMRLVTKALRQIGKVQELSMGFGGGKGAFQNMAKNYGVIVADDKAEEIKNAWRLAHPAVVQFWADLNNAAIAAVADSGKTFKAGAAGREITYKMAGSFLWCRLPSGRVLCYPYPEIRQQIWVDLEKEGKQWKKTFTGKDVPSAEAAAQKFATEEKCAINNVGRGNNSLSYMYEHENHWIRGSTYGGSLAENVTQAAAADVLRAGMLALEKANYPIVLHAHDEAVCEVPEGFGSVHEVESILAAPLEWAKGLPISAEGWRGKRYRK